MREIINVSLSHKANHLNTHFYNSQENILSYNPAQTSNIHTDKSAKNQASLRDIADLNVFNDAVVAPDKKTVSYTPRLMLWDLRHGFGSLDEEETYDESLARRSERIYANYGIETWNEASSSQQQQQQQQQQKQKQQQKVERFEIKNGKKQTKSDYQQALDNLAIDVPEVNLNNTHYWSDYARMIYTPKGFNSLQNWEIDPVRYPRGKHRYASDPSITTNISQGSKKAQAFSDFNYGVQEWQLNEYNLDYLDDHLRYFLERADNPQGINLVTECDSGWGGVASELLPLAKDEYLSKNLIFSWGLYDDLNKLSAADNGKISAPQLLTRIKSTLALLENSNLVFPMSMPSAIPSSFFHNNEQLELQLKASPWFETATQSLVYDSTLLLFGSKTDPVSMNAFELGLTMGNSKRNLVTSIDAAWGTMNDFIDSKFTKLDDFANELFAPLPNIGQRKRGRGVGNNGNSHSSKTPHVLSKNLIIRPPTSALLSTAGAGAGAAASSATNYSFDESLIIDNFGHFTDLHSNHGVPLRGLLSYSSQLPLSVPDTFPSKYLPIQPARHGVSVALEISTRARGLFLEYKKLLEVMLRRNSDEKEELVDQLASLAQEYEWGYVEDSEDDEDDGYY